MQLQLENWEGPCACGRQHQLATRGLWLEQGALARLPALLKGFAHPAVVCDSNTLAAAGKAVAALLPGACCICLPAEGLHANEHGVDLLQAQLPAGPDVLLAVGSGTVHDLTRFVAHARSLPFVSVPTAASVDGFVSTVAAMTWQGFKKTFPAVAPLYVVADSRVIAAAPRRLTAAGVGDLLGKYTALADWKAAHLLTGEYLCPRICSLEEQALQALVRCLPALAAGDPDAHEQLLYGLLLSGLAMQMCGNSRPASGAEHHFSHLWEMGALCPPPDALHGEKVGVGLCIASALYHKAADFLQAGAPLAPYRGIEQALLREKVPPALLPSLLQENQPDPLAAIPDQTLLENRAALATILCAVPAPDRLQAMLSQVGAPSRMADIGLDPALLADSIRLSPYVRNRLTVLRLCKRFAFYPQLCA